MLPHNSAKGAMEEQAECAHERAHLQAPYEQALSRRAGGDAALPSPEPSTRHVGLLLWCNGGRACGQSHLRRQHSMGYQNYVTSLCCH
jgi:hypothetical protein